MNFVMNNMTIPIIWKKPWFFHFFLFQLRPFTVPDSVLVTQIGWCGFVLLLESFSPSCCSLISSSVQPWLVLVPGVRSLKKNLPFMMIIAFTIHNTGKIFFSHWKCGISDVTFFSSYTNNGKTYSESDYGSEYGMMDNGDHADPGRAQMSTPGGRLPSEYSQSHHGSTLNRSKY